MRRCADRKKPKSVYDGLILELNEVSPSHNIGYPSAIQLTFNALAVNRLLGT